MSTDAVVNALVTTYNTGDPALMQFLAPGAAVWFNSDKQDHDALLSFDGLAHLRTIVDGLRMDIVEQLPTPGGVVLVVVIRGTVNATGQELASYNCIIVRVENGLLTRLEEYVDPTLQQQLGGA